MYVSVFAKISPLLVTLNYLCKKIGYKNIIGTKCGVYLEKLEAKRELQSLVCVRFLFSFSYTV